MYIRVVVILGRVRELSSKVNSKSAAKPTSGFPSPNSSTTEGPHRITCESVISEVIINPWNARKYRLLSIIKTINHSAPVFSHRLRKTVMPIGKNNSTPVLLAFQKHQAALRRFISRFVQRTQDIDDVAQEAFLRAYHAEKGRPIEQPKSFLFRIAHNVAITELTKKSTQIIDYIADIDESAVVWLEPSAEEQVSAEQLIGIHSEAVAHWIERCGNYYIQDFFSRYGGFYNALFNYAVVDSRAKTLMATEHRDIINCLLDKDWQGARKALQVHIRDQREAVSQMIVLSKK